MMLCRQKNTPENYMDAEHMPLEKGKHLQY